ncbi:nucleotidyltransferase domain-containing protein [Sulfurimonas sp. NW15]|uniref:nucleotidyltransferase family protein n=1 Tax=Sulfurimonas TaxID=202746 RepID=UPI00125FACC0|nr:nucleotidyltransferase domain-containing protein [Sulfurimonas hydrogeniphila]
MNKATILQYLKNKKNEFKKLYGINTLGLYGSYARDEAKSTSDIDIFYTRDRNFELKSGIEFLKIQDTIASELNVEKVDFVSLDFMNPIIKHYAKKDFIYV